MSTFVVVRRDAIDERTVNEALRPGLPALSHHDELDRILGGERGDRRRHVAAAERHRNTAELPRSSRFVANTPLRRGIHARQIFGGRLNVHRIPGRAEPIGKPAARRNSAGAFGPRLARPTITRSAANDGARSASLPPARRSIRCASSLSVNSRSRVKFAVVKKWASACGTLRRIHFAGLETFQQIFGRNVDVDDLVGIGQHMVRKPLFHLHAGGALDLVIETFEVLNVHGRDDMNAGEEILDVLITLGVLAAGGVRSSASSSTRHTVGPRENRVEIHLAKCDSTILYGARRNDFQFADLLGGLDAAVGLDQSDRDVDPLLSQPCPSRSIASFCPRPPMSRRTPSTARS